MPHTMPQSTETKMRLNITIEIDVEDLPVLPGAPKATVDGLVEALRLHTSHVTSNFEGEVVKFAVEKA